METASINFIVLASSLPVFFGATDGCLSAPTPPLLQPGACRNEDIEGDTRQSFVIMEFSPRREANVNSTV